jgi:hypothetical protein
VTQLLDRSLADSSTLYPRRPAASPGVKAANDFYLHGTVAPRQIHIQVTAPDGSLRRTWLAAHMEQEVNSLLLLPTGWDGYRAHPLTDEAVTSAVEILFALAGELSLPPQLFPLPDGGLQMEWHVGQSVEIEIDAAGAAHVLVVDDSGEVTLNDDLAPGDEALLARTRRVIDDLALRLARAR